MYKRKLGRSKAKLLHKTVYNCKFLSPKLLLVLAISIVCGTFISLLSHSPNSGVRQHFVSRWMLGGSCQDHRYASDLEIDWNHIEKVTARLKDRYSIQRIGFLNFNKREISNWKSISPYTDAEHVVLNLNSAAENVTWDSLYPEWIDEEEEGEVPLCPSLPELKAPPGKRLDLIAVKLPCRNEANWSRDVARLHLQLAAAGVAASVKGNHPLHLLFVTKCFPIPNMFTCKDLVAREGSAWLYKANPGALRNKIQLPVGSCELALPLGAQERVPARNVQREAYATILHSADVYVCGAIVAAQTIRMTGSIRDLVILVDETISAHHRSGLEAAGWEVRVIERIRNPKAERDAYNEWNYSKFRLWQLTDYDRVIFMDADILILRNIDFLFQMPEISATVNDGTLFNSGVMVIEPSNCTFKFLFGADPPVLYALHYLGFKPWQCFRDYDCNWNSDTRREYASDVAHTRWWKMHDSMPENLQQFCLLASTWKGKLEWDRRKAEKANSPDEHWKIEVKDPRLEICIDEVCSWEDMVMQWGGTNQTHNGSLAPSPPRKWVPIRIFCSR